MSYARNLGNLANNVTSDGRLTNSGCSGIVGIASGGTNSNITVTAGGVIYGTGSAFDCTTSRYLLVAAAESRGVDLRDYTYYCDGLQTNNDISTTVVANGISIKPTKLDSKDGGKTLTAESQKALEAFFVKTTMTTKLPESNYLQYFDKAGNLSVMRLSADSDIKALQAAAEKLTAAGKPSFAIATAYNK